MGKIKNRFGRKFISLKFRMLLLFFTLMLVVIGVLMSIFFLEMRVNYRMFSRSMIHSTAKIVYQSIYDDMMSNNRQHIQRTLELLALEPTINMVRIYRPSGTVLFSSNKEEKNKNVRQLDRNIPLLTSGVDSLFKKVDNRYFYQYPIVIHKECLQCHVNEGNTIKAYMNLYAGYPMSDRLYSSVKKYSIVGLLIMMVIMWFSITFLYKKQIEDRLQLINSGFKKLAAGNLKVRVNISGQHELAEIAGNFNRTVSKLQSAKDKEEQFYLEKLSQADRLVTLGEVVTEIAHAVNNPAGIVLSRVEYIRDQITMNQADEHIINELDAVIRQIELIGKVTKNIMYYARRLPGGFSKIDLNKAVRNSINILEPKIKKLQVKVHLDFPDSSSFVWGNSVQLEQVFCNLLNNSLDVLEKENGWIKIKVSEIITIKDKFSRFQITYQDNGPGIQDFIKDQIFLPFFTTKPQDQGTGLGLFIAKNIIKDHGGNIKLEKSPEHGVCFTIKINKYQ